MTTPLGLSLADRVYMMLLKRVGEFSTRLDSASSISVSGVVRSSPDDMLVCFYKDGNLDGRFALELPLVKADGLALDHMTAVKLLRQFLADRPASLLHQPSIAGRDFHGAPVFSGSDLLLSQSGLSYPVEDSVYLTLRSVLLLASLHVAESSDSRRFEACGFSHFTEGSVRIYLSDRSADEKFAIDVPIAYADDSDYRTASASLIDEVSALFRNGVPPNISSRGINSDSYSSRVYDLTFWFGTRSSSASR